jgi:hypothetical protein
MIDNVQINIPIIHELFVFILVYIPLRWVEHISRMGLMKNAYKILIGKPEGKRPLGRPRRRWEDIRMDQRERVRRCGLDSSGSGQGPVAGCCEHGNKPSGSITGGEFIDTLSDY